MVPGGEVASYEWDFGDGHTDVTTVPRTEHVYATPGTHTITLTETSTDGCSTEFTYTGQTVSCNGGKTAVVEHDVTVDLEDPTLVPPVDPPPAPNEPAVVAPSAPSRSTPAPSRIPTPATRAACGT